MKTAKGVLQTLTKVTRHEGVQTWVDGTIGVREEMRHNLNNIQGERESGGGEISFEMDTVNGEPTHGKCDNNSEDEFG